MKRLISGLVCVCVMAASVSRTAEAVDVVWPSLTGNWTTTNNWNVGATTGLSAQAAMARNNGLEVGGAELGTDVIIEGGAVTYDPNSFGDFRFRARNFLNEGTLTIRGGGSLSMATSDGTPDGYWTQWDGKKLTLDNGTFRRTADRAVGSTGGAMIWGSWRSFTGQVIDIDIKNGGRFENDGQMWFGTPGDNAVQLNVNVTVNNGHLDLTGGNSFTLDNDGALFMTSDLTFVYGFDTGALGPKNESYVINFTGAGSITVDQGGIWVAEEVDAGVYTPESTQLKSYQDLWNRGILRANGQSGQSGATFSNFFSVTGSPGQENYKLTSLLGGPAGDFNNDGNYNCSDIDALTAAISGGTNPAAFDITGDGLVNTADRDRWLSNAGDVNIGPGRAYKLGDANLNGNVDGSDFGIWNSNKFTNNTAFCSGNFSADGVVDGTDFGLWNANKFTSSDGSLVPEPASAGLVLVLSALASALRSRRG